MGRYVRDYALSGDPQVVFAALGQYLQAEGYEYVSFEGDNVFKKGHGLATGPTIFKFSFMDNVMRMETWMKYAVLPGVYTGEIDVDDFIGWAVKGPWKRRIAYIENMLPSYGAQLITYAPQAYYTPPVQAAPPVQAPPVQAAPVAKFCAACGAQVAPNTAFCGACGHKLV